MSEHRDFGRVGPLRRRAAGCRKGIAVVLLVVAGVAIGCVHEPSTPPAPETHTIPAPTVTSPPAPAASAAPEADDRLRPSVTVRPVKLETLEKADFPQSGVDENDPDYIAPDAGGRR